MTKNQNQENIISKRLKELREKKNISVRKLGEEVKLSYNTINAYETGRKVLSRKSADKLATFYQVNPEYLLGKSNVKFNYYRNLKDLINTSDINKTQKRIFETILSYVSELEDRIDDLENEQEYLQNQINEMAPNYQDPSDYYE